jgi:hypothetical protein
MTQEVLSRGGYQVIDPGEYYGGFSYEQLVDKWTNWIVSMDPERQNSPPVFFLRGLELDSLNQNHSNGEGFFEQSLVYGARKPSVVVGDDELVLTVNDAVFFPVVMAFAEPLDHPGVQDSYHSLYEYVNKDISEGDDPPKNDQITIDGVAIKADLIKHKIASAFTLRVPETLPGRSFNDVFDIPVTTPGERKCVALGYWLFIKFDKDGEYIIHSFARAKGGYESRLLYQIRVLPDESSVVKTQKPVPQSSTSYIIKRLDEKFRDGELTESQFSRIKDIIFKTTININGLVPNEKLRNEAVKKSKILFGKRPDNK